MPEFRHLGDQSVYRGEILDVVRAAFAAPDGAAFERDVVRVRGAVATVALVDGTTPQNPDTVLIRQYRGTIDRSIIEIPAGMRDVDGEPDVDNARRELVEEVGLAAGKITPLVTVWQSPGMTDGDTAIFLAEECTAAERTPLGPEEEHAEVVRLPLAEAVAMIERGEITDSKSVIGLLLAARRLGI